MAKISDEKYDGLEILSIGALYNGPLEKKYWSSTRGKDRYPYPVGYQALRTRNGVTYTMKIHEGLKGPLFMISSSDGQSCSGQTPDIAWGKFPKKGSHSIKLGREKRFSCKIDGVEFFGFKNSSVQRLLRELLANVGCTDQNLQPSSYGSLHSGMKHQTKVTDSFICPGPPLSCLDKPIIKGKRSRTLKMKNLNPGASTSLKKLRYGDCIVNAAEFSFRQGKNCSVENSMNHMPTKDQKTSSVTGGSLESLKEAGDGGNPSSVQDGFQSGSSQYYILKEGDIPQKEDRPLLQVSRLTSIETEGYSSLMAKQDKSGEIHFERETGNNNDLGLFAPDSLDLFYSTAPPVNENGSHSQETGQKDSSSDKDCNPDANELVISEEKAAELPLEAESDSPYAHSEKFSEVGREISESMMTCLLPRAVPLLKTFKRRKKKTKESSEIAPFQASIRKDNLRTEDNGTSTDLARAHIDGSNLEGQKETMHAFTDTAALYCHEPGQCTIFAPDSVDYDCGADDIGLYIPSLRSECPQLDTMVPPVLVDAVNEPTEVHACVNERQRMDFDNEVNVAATSYPKEEESFFAEFAPGFTPSSKTSYLGNYKVICEESDGCILKSEDSPGSSGGKDSSGPKKENNQDAFSAQQTDACTVAAISHSLLTESIICRSIVDGCAPDPVTSGVAPGNHPVSLFHHKEHESHPFSSESKFESLHEEKNVNGHNSKFSSGAQSVLCPSNDGYDLDVSTTCMAREGNCQTQFAEEQVHKVIQNSSLRLKNNVDNALEFSGRYVHPLPILSILLRRRENTMYICVLCGNLVDKDGTLFMYKVSLEEHIGSPSFIGYSKILFSVSRDAVGREIAPYRSGLQLTPDGQCLVFPNSIEAPYCRKGEIQCQCMACQSCQSQKDAIKVVQIKHGHVSKVTELMTNDKVHCLLVCPPSSLLGVQGNGALHLWTMNSTWSAPTETYDLSTCDCIFPCIVELKRIPNSAALVIGHNGFGEFGIWDICQRVLVARYSCPSTSILQIAPVTVFRWKGQGRASMNPFENDRIDAILTATEKSFSKHPENNSPILPTEKEENMVIWLLVSTTSDTEQKFKSSDSQMNLGGSCRLALLMENKVTLGSALESRATALGTSAGHGILGTCDGCLYTWEISTGIKLQVLHHLEGKAITCIAMDQDSCTEFLAVASGEHLLFYRSPIH
ncbi:uncharacterized protein LOC124921637 [Impatiens glandulifera]|uniref:uncharacterized protein LOC124921637 n=1 Tax=Impatiens glandulifera TaxID=253017 RepID=UPI001FB10563|nr:uncharacterized protein LOC124921637 [Impatiens glandulifera]